MIDFCMAIYERAINCLEDSGQLCSSSDHLTVFSVSRHFCENEDQKVPHYNTRDPADIAAKPDEETQRNDDGHDGRRRWWLLSGAQTLLSEAMLSPTQTLLPTPTLR